MGNVAWGAGGVERGVFGTLVAAAAFVLCSLRMSTVAEIEEAISKLSDNERLELQRLLSKRDLEAARKAAERKVDWTQSAAVTRERHPDDCISAEAVLDALGRL
jgi:hypothetical protein